MKSPQVKALALLPKFPALLSLFGSLYIVQHVLFSPERRSYVYHRLLLAMSCSDVIGSTVFFLSTWPIPRGYAYLAVGSQFTCTMSGMFNHFAGLTTPLYSGSLAVYYLLVIRYGWKERQVKKYEPLFHIVPLTLGFGTAIAGLSMQLFNPANWLCWIAPFPPGCTDDDTDDSRPRCTRGHNADLYRLVFMYGILWIIFIVVAVCMFLIYRHVNITEAASSHFDPVQSLMSNNSNSEASVRVTRNNNDNASDCGGSKDFIKKDESINGSKMSQARSNSVRSQSLSVDNPTMEQRRESRRQQFQTRMKTNTNALTNQVFWQAIMYVSAFYVTFIFGTIARLLQVWMITSYPVLICMTIFLPLQGFWQFYIYMVPRYRRVIKKNKKDKNKNKNSNNNNNNINIISLEQQQADIDDGEAERQSFFQRAKVVFLPSTYRRGNLDYGSPSSLPAESGATEEAPQQQEGRRNDFMASAHELASIVEKS